jgi:hypothetical protein
MAAITNPATAPGGSYVCTGQKRQSDCTGQKRQATYGQDKRQRIGAGEIVGTCRRARLVSDVPPPGGSGLEGRRCSCRVPPSVGSTGAVARKAGPRRLATHASPGTRGHMATSPGPCRQSPPALSWFRTPSLSLEDLGAGVSSAPCAAESRFNQILPVGQAGGEWADCTAMVTEVCAPHKVAS